MVDGIEVYGEFRLTSAVARRVQSAVKEFVGDAIDPDLSHIDDEECVLCRTQYRATEVPYRFGEQQARRPMSYVLCPETLDARPDEQSARPFGRVGRETLDTAANRSQTYVQP